MTSWAQRTLAQLPLPLLVAVPPVAAGSAAWGLSQEVTWALAAAGLAGLLVGREIGQQLTFGPKAKRLWTPEIARGVEATAALERKNVVLTQLAERRRGHTSPETSTTFRLFSQLVNAEEATRAQMAAELHDAVAQTLSQALSELRAGRPDQAVSSVEDAEEQLRAVMARMRPPELARGHLADAVGDLCADLDNRYAVSIAVSWPDASFPLPAPLATTFYRFVQEALLNAVVHADGVDVRLEVAVHGRELHVTVSDGGPGFDPEKVVSSGGRHVGLKLARERARLAGGVLDVQSAPGQGTRSTLRLPLEQTATSDPVPA